MNRQRDIAIAIVAGAIGLALVGAAFFFLLRQSTAAGGVQGTIVSKQLDAEPETQITVGSGGVRRRELPGICRFEVRDPEGGRLYTVTVDPTTYAAHQVGDRFYFVRPLPTR